MNFEPIAITLESPLMHGNEEITELKFTREMVAGDLRDVPVRDMTHNDICTVISRLTGVPAPVIKQLKMPDYQRASEVIASFLTDSPQTGETP